MATRANSVNHVGVTVRSIERSLDFYWRSFGLEPTFVHRVSNSPQLDRSLGVEGAELTIAFLEIGNTNVELLEYHTQRETDYGLLNCDVGAVHICFEVDDIRSSIRRLEQEGVEFFAEPLFIDDGPLEGHTFVYFKDPDGMTLELFEAPAPR